MFFAEATTSATSPAERSGGVAELYSDGLFRAGVGPARPAAMCSHNSFVAVGSVYPRAEVPKAGLDHLDGNLREMIQRLATRGLDGLVDSPGEFAVAVWNSASQELIAARDPLGVRPLFYAISARGIMLSDDLDYFRATKIDPDFVCDFIALRGISKEKSIWDGVAPVPPGTALRWHAGGVSFQRYWSTVQFPRTDNITAGDAISDFTSLLEASLRARVSPRRATWAHLSGGLDSSAVVSFASRMAAVGAGSALGGTVTFVDGLTDDQSGFVRDVSTMYGLRNEQVIEFWPWRSDSEPPPKTDQPYRDYPFYARDRLVGQIVRESGGDSILSGIGPDYYFPTTPLHIADSLRTGHWAGTMRAMLAWSVARRAKLWSAAARDIIAPLGPHWLSARLHSVHTRLPRWIRPQFAARHELRRRCAMSQVVVAEPGGLYDQAVRESLTRAASSVPTWCQTEGIDIRHPLLDRRLVEFCLTLPYRMRTDFEAPKPLLRLASKHILPDSVRARVTKAVAEPRMRWALGRERPLLSRLLSSAILADIGCIEPRALLDDIDECARGREGSFGVLYPTLSLETWLAVKMAPVGRLL